MACRWRIRHKLMVGLGLVVGILALLLGGTLKGLMSYSETMKSIDSKLMELQVAEGFKLAVTALVTLSPRGDINEQLLALQENVRRAREALDAYEAKLRVTIDRQRDPDKGFHENQLIGELRSRFAHLEQAVKHATAPRVAADASPRSVLETPEVLKAVHWLALASDELMQVIYQDIYERMSEAKRTNRTSLTIVISTSAVGILLMVGMLRFFYRWVFYPVRDLQQGVSRVAQGDFEHRIEVHSGDEMEDLAAAYNDMTGRLRDMYRDLAHQVNERSRQLVRSERLASVGFLAAGVAHEINNPLASIAFCSEALESRLAGVLPQAASDSEVITKYLRMIQQEAFRCKTITQRLLEFSRTGEKRREPTDLAELVQGVLDMVEHLQNSKGKHIVFERPGRRIVAPVNGQEIKSVVLNLVVNALDSMDEGGTLTITLRQRDGRAELLFADTGCGMPADVLENIFEPFFTRSRTGKGTGLGLSISHRVITQHGGEIEAASAGPGCGSTFTVRLPLTLAEAPLEGTRPAVPASESEPERWSSRAA